MSQVLSSEVNAANLSHVGWKYYNQIKKKAMEQEFSWFGLLTNLSIAFFIVISSAFCLSCLQKSIEFSMMKNSSVLEPQRVYQLEENMRVELTDISIFSNFV